VRSPSRAAPPVSGFLAPRHVRPAAAVLADGGIAVLPTDTLYGFHCAASNLDSVERIRGLKGRGAGSGFILLAADLPMVDEMVSRWPPRARATLEAIWPAPLTAILPASRIISDALAPRRKMAVRIPARAELRSLIRALGEPIVSTSVNITGRKPMRRIAEIRRRFPALDAYLSQRGRPGGLPSTVIDFTVKPPRLVRSGAYPWPAGG
jgi:L-threonylcarbamoyladenylate synthase